MPKDTRFSFEDKIIENLYNRHDQMLEGSGNVVALQPKLSSTSFAIMEDVQALLENPATRGQVECKLKDILSDVALGIIKNNHKL